MKSYNRAEYGDRGRACGTFSRASTFVVVISGRLVYAGSTGDKLAGLQSCALNGASRIEPDSSNVILAGFT